MGKELKLVLREQPVDVEPTLRQITQRERFARAARETREHFEGSRLKGADKVIAMNAHMRELLKS